MRTVTNFDKNTITVDEQELLENYRVLGKHEKYAVQQMIAYQQFKRVCNEYNASSQEEQGNHGTKQNSNIIHFKASTV
ncbi:MAG: hypothetical protein K2G55_14005 [Lachnospiraceae bacterium]|nr:hypothetical protein [Lachnospiraceae bacterium]MDE7203849.1 hypothetical protein [Lachnospiraceae bacterium]